MIESEIIMFEIVSVRDIFNPDKMSIKIPKDTPGYCCQQENFTGDYNIFFVLNGVFVPSFGANTAWCKEHLKSVFVNNKRQYTTRGQWRLLRSLD